MTDNRDMMKKAAAMSIAGVTLLGTAFGTAMTASAAIVDSNDITINESAGNVANTNLSKHTLVAYNLATYENAVFTDDGTEVENYGLKDNPNISEEVLMNALKAALVDADGNILPGWSDLIGPVRGNAANGIEFKGNAQNLSPMQFVAKYLYGAGTGADGDVDPDAHYNNDVDGHPAATVDDDPVVATKTEIRAFARSLQESGALSNGITATTTTDANGTTTATIAVPDDASGIYLIVDETEPGDTSEDTLSRAMIVGTAIPNSDGKFVDTLANNGVTLGQLNIKADNVTVEKTRDSQDTLNVGETQSFTIKTFIPNYKADEYNKDSLKFTVHDAPSSNLTLNKDSLKVYVGGDATSGTLLNLNKDYTIVDEATDDNPNGFAVALTQDAIWNNGGQNLTVQYNATVNNVTVDITDNTASVEFSNNPYDDTFATTDSDNVRILQADMSLEKIAMANKTATDFTALDGAEFTVTTQGSNTPLKWRVSANGATYELVDDSYIAKPGETVTTTVTLNSKTLGTPTTLMGLLKSDGNTTPTATTYVITETKAPAGYLLGAKPVSVTLTLTPNVDANGVITSITYSVAATGGAHQNFLDHTTPGLGSANVVPVNADGSTHLNAGVIRIENTTNPNDMAKTGGEITAILIAAAVLAVAGAGLGIAAKKRRANA